MEAHNSEASRDTLDQFRKQGDALAVGGELEAALKCYEDGLKRAPADPGLNLGAARALEKLSRLDAAEFFYRRSIAVDSNNADAYLNLGGVLRQRSDRAGAIECFRRAILLRPDMVLAWLNLGFDLEQQKLWAEASACYREALRLDPGHPLGHHYLGMVLCQWGQFPAAINSLQQAIELNPGAVEPYLSLGRALVDLGRVVEAVAWLRRAIEVDSRCGRAHQLLAWALERLGDVAGAIDSYTTAARIEPALQHVYSQWLFVLNYLDGTNDEDLVAPAREYGQHLARRIPAADSWPNLMDPEKPLRVGFVSGDFRVHPVGHFLVDVLAAIDQENFATYAYSTEPFEDELTERIKRVVPHWRPVAALSEAQLIEQIQADGIDILVDLAGHTTGNRLEVFAAKPAPLQMSWLGYATTTGLATIDYVLTDRWMVPADHESAFVEPVWRLPHSFVCFSPPEASIDVSPLPALSGNGVTFSCFNTPSKFSDRTLRCWQQILSELPTARLVLRSKAFSDPPSCQLLLDRFQSRGLDPARLILEAPTGRLDYLRRFQGIDMALDPFPYNGGTTTVEALWMGVPVLSLSGRVGYGRQGESFLRSVGLDDWIATDDADYVSRAIRFARDLPMLDALRGSLREQLMASPLGNSKAFAGDLMTAWRRMWRLRCNGPTPR